MAGFNFHQRVEAPIDRVFEVFTDFEKAPERVESIEQVEFLTDGPVGEGTRLRETRTISGVKATEELTITRFDPGHGYAVTCESHGCVISTACLFYPVGEKATTVEVAFDAEPQTMMAKMKVALLLPAIKREFQKDLEALQAVAES